MDTGHPDDVEVDGLIPPWLVDVGWLSAVLKSDDYRYLDIQLDYWEGHGRPQFSIPPRTCECQWCPPGDKTITKR